MTNPALDLFTAAATPPAKSEQLLTVARRLVAPITDGKTVTRQQINAAMTDVFEVTDASGIWSMRDGYDALEVAQVIAIRDDIARTPATLNAARTIEQLDAMLRRLPTQTYRSEGQVARQQFSTPMTLAWLVAAAAQLDATDVVLEPSAGTGMLAAWLPPVARLVLNEIDAQRAALLAGVFDCNVSAHDAEMVDDLLDPTLLPTAIVMNPPFSRSERRGDDAHAGARHLRSALLRLAAGGRCVAIMPSWFAPHESGRDGYLAAARQVTPRLDILIGGSAYAKHGTGIDVRILVYDKGWTGEPARHSTDDLIEAHSLLTAAPRLPRATMGAAAIVRKPLFPPRRTAPGLFGSIASARVTTPTRAMIADQSAVPLRYAVLAEPRAAADPIGIYVPYRVSRIDITDATSHPTPLVESVAMASILPPVPAYAPMLPPRAAAALSDAQLETVIYAGQAFDRDLAGLFKPNEAGTVLEADAAGRPYRQGYFLGDGTGAGKGRQVAGIVFDQWCQGRRKALWISKTTSLLEDARRDWAALGGLAIDIQPIDGFPLGTAIIMPSGILFMTYSTLRSQRHDEASRLQQILAWLGDEHDGMVVFDEAHAMANAAGTETSHGTQKGSEQGLAGVRLQNYLPRARVLYVSATGATDVANLCYTSRLGLWGAGTAFATRETFLSEMTEGGIAALELVARDLKAQGLYTARALSFAGVEYDMLEHKLTLAQIEIYDAYADAWQIIHQNLEAALVATNIFDAIEDKALNGPARNSALSRFESSKQRFFGQLLISMKLPTLLPAIEHEIAQGHAVVVQLVTTAEAMLGRRIADLSAEERANLDIELSPREYIIDYLSNAFPTRMMQTFLDDKGVEHSEPMVDPEGRPVHCQAALRARDELIERLCAMPAVGSALDELLRRFGTANVAEVTGRTKRLVYDSHGQQQLERRSGRSNLGETSAFMDGTKRILAFSDAGGTGRSYHADLGTKSAGYRRVHFLLEPGWKAAEAIQGLGRSNRTNQASAPIFRPVTTDCRGERRFISTIARRLDSLGALTRGQRQTGGQNLFNPADNLESDYAKDALVQWYHLLYAGTLKSITLSTFIDMTALKLIDKDSSGLVADLPPIQRWLNRLLALRIGVQEAIFEEYLGLIEARIEAAREAGTLDLGVETIAAETVTMLAEHILRVDPASGAATKLVTLELHRRRKPTSLARLAAMWEGSDETRRLKNAKSGRVALRVPSFSLMADDGAVIRTFQLIRPTGAERIREAALEESHWEYCGRTTFETLWQAEIDDALTKVDVETIHLATGLLLPVWNKLPGGSVQVWRITDAAGNALLGRIVPAKDVAKLAGDLGVNVAVNVTVGEIVAAARTREGIHVAELGNARLALALVNGQQRIEIKDYPADQLSLLKTHGCFTEIVAFKTRLFVPVDRAADVIAKMLGRKD